MNQNELNQSVVDAFGEQMVGILNNGALAVMVGIGHRTRLFDTLAELPPASSAQIATAAGLQERYVREWLAALTTGRIVNYDPSNQRYHLPAEHAAFLTRAATPNNMAVTTQFIGMFGAVEDGVVEAFHLGGGVPYSKFHRFHEVMAEDSYQTVVSALINHILPLAPGLSEALQRGIDVLDLGCGQGRALTLLAATFPNSRFIGYDLSPEAIASARDSAAQKQLNNVTFDAKDVTRFDETNRYDLICTFDAIHDQAQPAAVLRGIYHALRPNGTYLMQDIAGSSRVENNLDHPFAPFLYTISCMHCMTVSLAQGGEGLGTLWGRELAQQMLSEAGFTNVTVQQLAHDPLNDYYVIRK